MKYLPFDEKDFKKLDKLIELEPVIIHGRNKAASIARSRANQKAKRQAAALAKAGR